jgi:hypothetical protein
MTRRLIGLGLVVAIFASSFVVAQAPRPLFMLEVKSKAWGTVPEAYQRADPGWKTRAGVHWSPTRKIPNHIYLGRVGGTGWQYLVKDQRGNEFTLYAGESWRWNSGEQLIITGYTDALGVFIPQGERCYVVK